MCTNITIKAKDESVIVGRSMENAVFMKSNVFFRSEGYHYTQDLKQEHLVYRKGKQGVNQGLKPIKGSQLHQWKGRYSFVAMSALGVDLVAHGMNSEGLVTGDMTFIGSEYQSFGEKDDTLIAYPFLAAWLLSTCGSCQDVKDKLPEFRVVDPFVNMHPGFFFHFPVNDSKGNAIVIEFINGELNIYDNNEIGVLTNDPKLPWQHENLKNYASISPVNVPKEKGNRFSVASMAQGTGFSGLPGSSTPVDRYVRAAMMANYAYDASTGNDAINLAAHIMNTVDIPRGTSRVNEESAADKQLSDFTQWITLSNTKDLKYYVRSYDTPLMFVVDFKSILSEHTQDLSAINELEYAIPKNRLAVNLIEEFAEKLVVDAVS